MRFGSAADQPHDLEPHRVPCEFVRVIEWSAPELSFDRSTSR